MLSWNMAYPVNKVDTANVSTARDWASGVDGWNLLRNINKGRVKGKLKRFLPLNLKILGTC